MHSISHLAIQYNKIHSYSTVIHKDNIKSPLGEHMFIEKNVKNFNTEARLLIILTYIPGRVLAEEDRIFESFTCGAERGLTGTSDSHIIYLEILPQMTEHG